MFLDVSLLPFSHSLDSSASGEQFLKFTFLVLLLAFCGQSIGLVVSCAIESRMLAMIVAPLAIAPFILFTPYAVNVNSIPYYFIPFQVGSPFWVRKTSEEHSIGIGGIHSSTNENCRFRAHVVSISTWLSLSVLLSSSHSGVSLV